MSSQTRSGRASFGAKLSEVDIEAIRRFVMNADTFDLLDRVTILRHEMEPEALKLMENELDHRGIEPAMIQDYRAERASEVVFRNDGSISRCCQCGRAAVQKAWVWHRMYGKVPIFPMVKYFCDEHMPEPKPSQPRGEPDA